MSIVVQGWQCGLLIQIHLLIGLKTIQGSNSIVFFISEPLQNNKHSEVKDLFSRINNHLNNDIDVRSVPVKNFDSFTIFRTWYAYHDTNKNTTSPTTTVLVLPCHMCFDLQTTLLKPALFCEVICFNEQESIWTSCGSYSTKLMVYSSIMTQLFSSNDSLVIFYDDSSEHTLLPALENTIASHTKTIFLDSLTLRCSNGSEMCLYTLENLAEQRNFYISVNFQMMDFILQQISEKHMIGPEFHWLIDQTFKEQMVSPVIPYMDIFENIAVLMDADQWTEDYTIWRLLDQCLFQVVPQIEMENLEFPVFNIHRCTDGCIRLSNISTVTSTGRIANKEEIFNEEFQGFGGKLFSIVTKTYYPFVKLTKNNGKEEYSGLVVEILDALSSTLKFRYRLYEVPDGQFGIGENGTWTGMIGVVHRKEADMAASGITISASRDAVVDFTFPFWEEPSAVLIRRSMDGMTLFLENVLWIYKPLTVPVWISFFIAIGIISWILYMYTKLYVKISYVKDILAKPVHASWYIIGAFLQQGGYHRPKTGPGQLVSSFWLFVIIILYGIYTGNLIAVLSVKKLTMPFDTLQGMVKSDFTYGAEAGIIHLMLFKEAKSGIYSDIWEGISENPDSIVPDGKSGLEKVKRDKYALIGDKTYLHANSIDDCDLSLIKEEFYKVGFGFAVQEGWPYKKYFDLAIMKLLRGGFIERWKQKHWPKDECGIKFKYVQSKSISVASMSGNFVCLFVGILISCTALILEHYIFRFKEMLLNRNVRKSGIIT